MANDLKPLFIRLPRRQAAALDRLSRRSGRPKQHVVSELVAQVLAPAPGQLQAGRIDLTAMPDVRHEEVRTPEVRPDDVLTLEEVASLFKLPPDAVRARAEQGDVPGRRFGGEWRFSRLAVLGWLADGDPQVRRKR